MISLFSLISVLIAKFAIVLFFFLKSQVEKNKSDSEFTEKRGEIAECLGICHDRLLTGGSDRHLLDTVVEEVEEIGVDLLIRIGDPAIITYHVTTQL